MTKEYKHGEELRKYWQEAQRKYRAKKKGNKIIIIDEKGKPMLVGEIVDRVPKIRRKQK